MPHALQIYLIIITGVCLPFANYTHNIVHLVQTLFQTPETMQSANASYSMFDTGSPYVTETLGF
jgi:hypothetical protein